MKKTLRALPLIALLFAPACTDEAPPIAEVPIIPWPASISRGDGSFTIDSKTVAVFTRDATDEASILFMVWIESIRNATGLPLPLQPGSEGTAPSNSLSILMEVPGEIPAEGYRLSATSEGVRITASSESGLFYGLQTLRQMLPPQVEHSRGAPGDAEWVVPFVEITDTPRFPYRGMHLDVGRHFFTVDFVKRYIDLMSRYKMNYFHWHLTEDQGWRIEIKKYPRLTEIGSIRRETILEKNFNPYVGDGIPHAGYYTQDDIREIVAYASERFITVIPEIELPGHSMAALAAYPELACTDEPREVSTVWGVKDDIFCPKEQTFEFLQDVLSEVIELFPGPYIHIGGDEVPKRRWEESTLAQDVIRREGLGDEAELQSWFIRRIESFLLERGKRLIGWDEILEGGLAPEATVMSWRGMTGGIEAARQGHDVIMTPTHYCYFDYYQADPETEPLAIGGLLPLDTVYVFEPVPDELTEKEAAHILGAQGNVWTEYMKTPEYVEYMAFPRAIALAEVVWSPKEARNFDHFLRRLEQNLQHLDVLGVNYRIPEHFADIEAAMAMVSR